MGAGQHHGVRARIAIDEAGRDLGENRAVAHGLAAQGGLRQCGEIARADQRYLAALREIGDQLFGVFALHGAARAEHGHPLRP